MIISTTRSTVYGSAFYSNAIPTIYRGIRCMSSRNTHSFPVGSPGSDLIGPESPHYGLFVNALKQFNKNHPRFIDESRLQGLKTTDSVVLKELLSEVFKLNQNFDKYFRIAEQDPKARIHFINLSEKPDY